MLALQSKTPDNLGHTSVSIGLIETFCKSVDIRINTVKFRDTGEIKEKLELVFEHDEDTKKQALRKIERNKAY